MGFSGSPVTAGRVGELTHIIQKYSFETLDSDGFVRVNFGPSTINSTLDAVAAANNGVVPTGLLGSSIVTTKGNAVVGGPTAPTGAGAAIDLTERPRGVLLRDILGLNSFDGTRTDEGNLPTFYTGHGSRLRIGIYETNTFDGGTGGTGLHTSPAAPLVYAPGDQLFVNFYTGLLTKQLPVDGAGKSPPDGTFQPTDVKNGIYPFVFAEVIETDFDGTTDLVIEIINARAA